jgi:hypothetical protein
MVKVLPIILLCISISFAITEFQYPSSNLKLTIGNDRYTKISNKIEEVAKNLDIKSIDPITIFESDNLKEFSNLTGKTYDIGGIYKNNFIITQPFGILISKKLLTKVLTHELLHYVIQLKYKLPLWMEEGYIEYVLNDRVQDLKGYHKEYLIDFMRKIIDEEKDIVVVFNSYRR